MLTTDKIYCYTSTQYTSMQFGPHAIDPNHVTWLSQIRTVACCCGRQWQQATVRVCDMFTSLLPTTAGDSEESRLFHHSKRA